MARRSPLIDVLRLPGVARALGSSLVGRLSYTSIGLLLILHVRDLGGGYAGGGLVVAAFSIAMAIGAPLVGRMVDARGQTGVLWLTAVAGPAPLLAIALLPHGMPIAVIAVLAAVGGIGHPPLSGCMRALWSVLIADRDQRHAAFSLEAAAIETTFVVGPVILVGGVGTFVSYAAGLAACAALLAAGTLAFASAPASRGWRPAARRGRRRAAGALSSPGLLALMVGVAFLGASFGAVELATTAFADERGAPGAVALLLAVWGAGSLVGGVLYARRGAPPDPVRAILLMLAGLAAADALLAAMPGIAALAAALVIAGAAIAPSFATLYGMVEGISTPGTLTESYTWLLTGIYIGSAAGSAVAGSLVEASSSRAGFALGAAAVAAAVLALGARRATLRAQHEAPAPTAAVGG
ncbi:MAG: MFS transporter [Thermoleophilia bacterium]